MKKKLFIKNNFNSFKKTISVDGDKSISIRTLLLGSQAYGKTFRKHSFVRRHNKFHKMFKKLGIKISLIKITVLFMERIKWIRL